MHNLVSEPRLLVPQVRILAVRSLRFQHSHSSFTRRRLLCGPCVALLRRRMMCMSLECVVYCCEYMCPWRVHTRHVYATWCRVLMYTTCHAPHHTHTARHICTGSYAVTRHPTPPKHNQATVTIQVPRKNARWQHGTAMAGVI